MGVNIYPQYPPIVFIDSRKIVGVPDNVVECSTNLTQPSIWTDTTELKNTVQAAIDSADDKSMYFNLCPGAAIEEKDDLCKDIFNTSINKYVSVKSKTENPPTPSGEIEVLTGTSNAYHNNHYLLLRYVSKEYPTIPEFFAYNYDVINSSTRKYSVTFNIPFKGGNTVFFEPGVICSNDFIDIPITYHPIEKLYPETPKEIALIISFNLKSGENIQDLTLSTNDPTSAEGKIITTLTNAIFGTTQKVTSPYQNGYAVDRGKLKIIVYSPIRLSLIGTILLRFQDNTGKNYKYMNNLYSLTWMQGGSSIKFNQAKTISELVLNDKSGGDKGNPIKISTTITLDEDIRPQYVIDVTCECESEGITLNQSDYSLSIRPGSSGSRDVGVPSISENGYSIVISSTGSSMKILLEEYEVKMTLKNTSEYSVGTDNTDTIKVPQKDKDIVQLSQGDNYFRTDSITFKVTKVSTPPPPPSDTTTTTVPAGGGSEGNENDNSEGNENKGEGGD